MEHHTIYNGNIKCKKRHNTFKTAMNNALKFNSNKNNLGKRKLHPYKCDKCKGFHLGKQVSNVNDNVLNKSITLIYKDILSKVKFKIDLSVIDKKRKK